MTDTDIELKHSFISKLFWKIRCRIRYSWLGIKWYELSYDLYEKTHPYGICVCNSFICDYDSDFYKKGDIVQFMSYLRKQWNEATKYDEMLVSKVEKAKRFRTKKQAFKEINRFEQKAAEIIGDVVEAEVCVF